jgi:hypothetical protein
MSANERPKPPLAFDEWCAAVDAIASEWVWTDGSYTLDCGREYFRERYEAGCAPREVMQDEAAYAAADADVALANEEA